MTLDWSRRGGKAILQPGPLSRVAAGAEHADVGLAADVAQRANADPGLLAGREAAHGRARRARADYGLHPAGHTQDLGQEGV